MLKLSSKKVVLKGFYSIDCNDYLDIDDVLSLDEIDKVINKANKLFNSNISIDDLCCYITSISSVNFIEHKAIVTVTIYLKA